MAFVLSVTLPISGNAATTVIGKGDFFDIGFANTIWREAPNQAAYDALDKKYCRVEYKALRSAFTTRQWNLRAEERKAARAEIANRTDADMVKRCIDVDLIFYKWERMVFLWSSRIIHDRSPFNGLPEGSKTCQAIKTENIFTGSCNDLPDWRTDRAKAEEAKALKTYRQPVSK